MIYLDYNATTPVLPEVRDAMLPFLNGEWGNPSSAYHFGARLKGVLNDAREAVADLIRAESEEVLFTSCATESNNAAIHAALRSRPGKRHIVTSSVEHSAVLNYCRMLEEDGCRVTYLPVDEQGLLRPEEVARAVTDSTAVVSLMWANNETGVLFPIDEIGAVCRERGVLLHCDAAQAVGKLEVDAPNAGADYLTVSAHKIYGPKGIGALYIRKRSPFTPLLVGGHQERGRRGGTENLALVAGLGEAARLAKKDLCARGKRASRLRDLLEKEVLAAVPGSYVNGCRKRRLPNTTNIGFPDVDSDSMVALLDSKGICVSSGSACLSETIAPSHVVLAMTGSERQARRALRLSVSHLTTEQEIQEAAGIVGYAATVLNEMR